MNLKVIISEHTKVVLIEDKIKDKELLKLLNFCKEFNGETDKAIFYK